MSSLTFPKALHQVLEPAGFARDKMVWTRLRGDLEDTVRLDRSWSSGAMTATLEMRDLATDRILRGIDCETPLFFEPVDVRIGHLMDRLDHWWNKEPNGPAALAEAVRTYGLPWFATVRTLEEQAEEWITKARTNPLFSAKLPAIVVTLVRLGRSVEALRYFAAPPGKMMNPLQLARRKCLQRWLEAQLDMEPGTGGAYAY